MMPMLALSLMPDGVMPMRPLRLAPLLLLAAVACDAPRAGRAPSAPADSAAPAAALTLPSASAPGDTAGTVRQVVYVPAYSHIYFSDHQRVVNLAVTLSVRNTDPQHPITITAVRYYDDAGRLVRGYLNAPARLGPMASTAYVVDEKDTSGGVGANFIVEWTGPRSVTDPLIEAVMISAASSQGISFTSRGQPLYRR